MSSLSPPEIVRDSDNDVNSREIILVTGGAGFIGSHTVLDLVLTGFKVVAIDNLVNSAEEALRRVEKISNLSGRIVFRKTDIRDIKALETVFQEFSISACIHFAGAKAVAESVMDPLYYYDNNVIGTVNILKMMQKHGCRNLVVSSSATVYGIDKKMPLKENSKLGATNPYGRSKHIIEQICNDVAVSDHNWNIIVLRYFNPCGAHKSGIIGEDPCGIPNNLMPILSQVAVGRRNCLSIYGDDYDTLDGTPVRDYVHVVDIARGHVDAVKKLNMNPGFVAVNLGTGKGTSVLQMVTAMSRATGIDLPYKIVPRRDGDVAISYTNPSFAKDFLGWEAKLSIDDMCSDAWRWQSQFPNGYGTDLS